MTNAKYIGIITNMIYEKIKKGFTLAEVLITLGIIGIVAALTLPGLIQKHNKKVVETNLKTVYSLLGNAVQMIEAEEGVGFIPPNCTDAGWDDCDVNGFSESYSEQIFNKYYLKKLNVIKMYNTNKSSTGKSIFLIEGNNGGEVYTTKSAKYVLKNGIMLSFVQNPNGCQYFTVYLKKIKGKYIAGRNVFSFYVYNEKGHNRVAPALEHRYQDNLRPYFINSCVSTSSYPMYSSPREMFCTILITRNNWTIPDDYPIKF